jgi:hypothetical protein
MKRNRPEKPVVQLALSRRSAARSIDKSEGWLRLRERYGDGPPMLRAGRAVLYPVAALKEWLTRNSSTGGPDAV